GILMEERHANKSCGLKRHTKGNRRIAALDLAQRELRGAHAFGELAHGPAPFTARKADLRPEESGRFDGIRGVDTRTLHETYYSSIMSFRLSEQQYIEDLFCGQAFLVVAGQPPRTRDLPKSPYSRGIGDKWDRPLAKDPGGRPPRKRQFCGQIQGQTPKLSGSDGTRTRDLCRDRAAL